MIPSVLVMVSVQVGEPNAPRPVSDARRWNLMVLDTTADGTFRISRQFSDCADAQNPVLQIVPEMHVIFPPIQNLEARSEII
jgi:hypothetical protein